MDTELAAMCAPKRLPRSVASRRASPGPFCILSAADCLHTEGSKSPQSPAGHGPRSDSALERSRGSPHSRPAKHRKFNPSPDEDLNNDAAIEVARALELRGACQRFSDLLVSAVPGSGVDLQTAAQKLRQPYQRLQLIADVLEALRILKRTGRSAYCLRSTLDLPLMLHDIATETDDDADVNIDTDEVSRHVVVATVTRRVVRQLLLQREQRRPVTLAALTEAVARPAQQQQQVQEQEQEQEQPVVPEQKQQQKKKKRRAPEADKTSGAEQLVAYVCTVLCGYALAGELHCCEQGQLPHAQRVGFRWKQPQPVQGEEVEAARARAAMAAAAEAERGAAVAAALEKKRAVEQTSRGVSQRQQAVMAQQQQQQQQQQHAAATGVRGSPSMSTGDELSGLGSHLLDGGGGGDGGGGRAPRHASGAGVGSGAAPKPLLSSGMNWLRQDQRRRLLNQSAATSRVDAGPASGLGRAGSARPDAGGPRRGGHGGGRGDEARSGGGGAPVAARLLGTSALTATGADGADAACAPPALSQHVLPLLLQHLQEQLQQQHGEVGGKVASRSVPAPPSGLPPLSHRDLALLAGDGAVAAAVATYCRGGGAARVAPSGGGGADAAAAASSPLLPSHMDALLAQLLILLDQGSAAAAGTRTSLPCLQHDAMDPAGGREAGGALLQAVADADWRAPRGGGAAAAHAHAASLWAGAGSGVAAAPAPPRLAAPGAPAPRAAPASLEQVLLQMLTALQAPQAAAAPPPPPASAPPLLQLLEQLAGACYPATERSSHPPGMQLSNGIGCSAAATAAAAASLAALTAHPGMWPVAQQPGPAAAYDAGAALLAALTAQATPSPPPACGAANDALMSMLLGASAAAAYMPRSL